MNNYNFSSRDTPSPPPHQLYSGSASSSSGINSSNGGVGSGGGGTSSSTTSNSQFNQQNGTSSGPGGRYSLINKLQHHPHYGQTVPHQVSTFFHLIFIKFIQYFSIFFLSLCILLLFLHL